MKNKKYNSPGFTLLEILLVVGIISILAGIVIIAINPSKQLATVRNLQRKSDIKQINNAVTQFYIDKSYHPASTTLVTSLTEICATGASSSPAAGFTCTGLINLSELVPAYLVSIPTDPQGTSISVLDNLIPTAYAAAGGTGYKVMKSSNKITLMAPNAELSIPIVTGALTDPCSHTSTDSNCWSAPVSGLTWGPVGTITSVQSLTAGAVNTATLAGLTGDYPAVDYCDALTEGGFTDWYLPASDQLAAGLTAQFITSPATLSRFVISTSYWSSSEFSAFQPATYVVNRYYSGGVGSGMRGKTDISLLTRCLR